MPQPVRYSLRVIVIWMPIAALQMAGLVIVPAVEVWKVNQLRHLQVGTTKSEVLQSFGEPSLGSDIAIWTYDVYWFGWASVYFDENEQVLIVHIESPFD